MKKYSRIRAEIDLDAVRFNFESMKNNLTPGTKMAAVIKADGYGHGAVQIARLIHEFDYIWGFAVATPEEAMQLRAKGISKPIMLLGYAFEESYEDLIDYDIRVCVFEEETAGALSACAKALGKTAIIQGTRQNSNYPLCARHRHESDRFFRYSRISRSDKEDCSPSEYQGRRSVHSLRESG